MKDYEKIKGVLSKQPYILYSYDCKHYLHCFNRISICILLHWANKNRRILKEGTTEDAQGIAIKSLEYLSTEEKEFYDINFIFTNTAEDDNAKFFPLMGYKKSDATLISWIKQSERK